MGGRGPNPKDPEKRARTNQDSAVQQVVVLHPVNDVQKLPETFNVLSREGSQELAYPQQTRDWWQNWVDSPFSAGYDALIWERLRMAADLHARAAYGDMNAFKEYRLHMNNFPETPGDRLRLRIQTAEAAGAEVDTAVKVTNARNRFRGMTVAPDEIESA